MRLKKLEHLILGVDLESIRADENWPSPMKEHYGPGLAGKGYPSH